MSDWGRPWTPERDREDDEPHARCRPRRPAAEMLDEARAIVAHTELAVSSHLVTVANGPTASGFRIGDPDALERLETCVERGEYDRRTRSGYALSGAAGLPTVSTSASPC